MKPRTRLVFAPAVLDKLKLTQEILLTERRSWNSMHLVGGRAAEKQLDELKALVSALPA